MLNPKSCGDPHFANYPPLKPSRGYGQPLAGQKGKHFTQLRDIMIVALKEIADKIDPENMTGLFADSKGKIRAITDWEETERVHVPPYELPVDNMVNDSRNDLLDDAMPMEPPYDSAKSMPEFVSDVVHERVPTKPKRRKRKRGEREAGPIMAFVS